MLAYVIKIDWMCWNFYLRCLCE